MFHAILFSIPNENVTFTEFRWFIRFAQKWIETESHTQENTNRSKNVIVRR